MDNKNKHIKAAGLILVSSLFSPVLFAEHTININMSALEFTGVVQQNLKGAFDLFVKDIEKNPLVKHNYHVVSPARGAKEFFQKQSQCLIPGSLYPPYYQGLDVIHSKSFAQVTYLAFTLPDQAVIQSKAQLEGKVIGVIRDADTWNYEQRFNIENVDYVKVSSLEALVELLYKKRVDVAIHDHSDFLALAKHLHKPQPNYDESFPMAIDKLVISCHKSAETQAYLEQVNIEINKLEHTGLAEYFSRSSIN